MINKMRTREEIEHAVQEGLLADSFVLTCNQKLIVEVLLDIRDLLIFNNSK